MEQGVDKENADNAPLTFCSLLSLSGGTIPPPGGRNTQGQGC